MNQEELNEILRKHKMWLNDEKVGKRADLRRADLQWANLKRADLRRANLREANLQRADLQWANLEGADLQWANLKRADLREANLREANLRGADLDFSVFPLWCGSFDMKVDWNIFSQILYHLCRLDCDDERAQKVIALVREYANQAPVRERHDLPEIKEVEE